MLALAALQPVQQRVIGFGDMPAAAQIGLHAQQQMRGHLGIGERPVGLVCWGQLQMAHDLAQGMAGRLGVQAPRQQHGAGKQRGRCHWRAARARQFIQPELAVKRGVVRHQRRAADKIGRFAHHLCCGRSGLQHGRGDTGQLRDKAGHALARIHQALVAVHNAAAFNHHNTHLGRARTVRRAHAGGFKVEDGDAFGHG